MPQFSSYRILFFPFEVYLEGSGVRRERAVFSFQEVTFSGVRDAIGGLKKKHSRDIYGLNTILLDSLKDVLISPLTRLFNLCIRRGVYPSAFKLSKVIPVFKNGDQQMFNNYSPISLIPIFSMAFEVLLKNQLYKYFEDGDLLLGEQFGFRRGKSTTGAVCRLCDYIVEGFEGGDFVASTFCDLPKAFDCVSHDILVRKLEFYGLDEGSIGLIQSYLADRRQVTCFQERLSEERIMRHGVPQGSILGPQLFLVYINDINMQTIQVFSLDQENIQLSRPILMNSLMARMIGLGPTDSLNRAKTERIIFSLRRDDTIMNPDGIKFLGISLDPKLTFEQHVTTISKKIVSAIFVLRNLTRVVEHRVCLMAYHSLVHSVCVYGVRVKKHMLLP